MFSKGDLAFPRWVRAGFSLGIAVPPKPLAGWFEPPATKTFYNADPQKEHDRLEQHQLEYELTWRYFDHYLPPTGSILEIGAATGRYTLELAKRGYTVTAVDLSAGLIDANRQNLIAAGLKKQV